MPSSVGVAIIGAGKIALANHLPGLKVAPPAKVVALCDTDRAAVERAGAETCVRAIFTDYREAIARPEVDAVIVATPNFTHPEIVRAAAAAKKHVMCEKPLANSAADALAMLRAVESAGVRHMTAFTYRFVPAMRYMTHLVQRGNIGTPYHFRAQRFQDWGDRALGWRQVKKLCGTGELGDMLSHRIDFAHALVGPMQRLVASLRNLVPTRGGKPSDVDDWVSILCDFQRGATGVLESTKLATGRGEGHRGVDVCEVNGPDGTLAYSTQRPNELLIGRKGSPDLERIDVPREFLVWPGSPRDPDEGDPMTTFRYDQDFEFIDAIVNERECRPSFKEGLMTQIVMDAAVKSSEEREWVDVDYQGVNN